MPSEAQLHTRLATMECALQLIARDEHEPGCRYACAPRSECPTCPGPKIIAREALRVCGLKSTKGRR